MLVFICVNVDSILLGYDTTSDNQFPTSGRNTVTLCSRI